MAQFELRPGQGDVDMRIAFEWAGFVLVLVLMALAMLCGLIAYPFIALGQKIYGLCFGNRL
jgi:hypothetical protein